MADFSSEWSKISKKKQSAEGASFPFNLVPVLPGEGEGRGRERVLKKGSLTDMGKEEGVGGGGGGGGRGTQEEAMKRTAKSAQRDAGRSWGRKRAEW